MPTQPKLGNILSKSWEIFTANIKPILIITLVIYIPINTVLELIPTDNTGVGITAYFQAMQLLEGFFGILATIAIAFLTKAALEKKDISWKESLKLAINKWLKVIGTNLLAGILLVGLFFLLIVPGIIFSIYWYFILYVVIFSDKWGFTAMAYSKDLVQNRWWPTLGYAVLFGFMALLAGAVASLPMLFVPEHVVFYILGDLVIDISIAFFSVLGAVWYLAWDASKIKSSIKA
jgi:hypothetical protein